MRERKFRRSGLSFARRGPGDIIQVVAFQKHPLNTAEHLGFWVNAGVWSARLAEIVDRTWGVPQARPPSVHGCQWRLAHSDMMAEEYEAFGAKTSASIYWTIHPDHEPGDLAGLAATVRQRLAERAIPAVEAMSSETALRDVLLAATGSTFGVQLQAKLAYELVKMHGPRERLPELEATMRGEPWPPRS